MALSKTRGGFDSMSFRSKVFLSMFLLFASAIVAVVVVGRKTVGFSKEGQMWDAGPRKIMKRAKMDAGNPDNRIRSKLESLLASDPGMDEAKMVKRLQDIIRGSRYGYMRQPGSYSVADDEREETRERFYRDLSARMRDYQQAAMLERPGSRVYTPPYVWDLFEPIWSCDTDYRVGGVGDGGKWLCNLQELKPPCRIYSFGISDFFPFEEEIVNLTRCELFGFDPTPGLDLQVHRRRIPGAQFFPYGLSNKDGIVTSRAIGGGLRFITMEGTRDRSMRTLKTLMNQFGHDGMEVLKMDIEGGEWDVLDGLFSDCTNVPPRLRLLLVEVHLWKITMPDVVSTFQRIEDCGFRIYHKEPNLYHSQGTRSPPCCVEYAWIRVP